eukprot:3287838-Prorocentrum_lima.AAC.1
MPCCLRQQSNSTRHVARPSWTPTISTPLRPGGGTSSVAFQRLEEREVYANTYNARIRVQAEHELLSRT